MLKATADHPFQGVNNRQGRESQQRDGEAVSLLDFPNAVYV